MLLATATPPIGSMAKRRGDGIRGLPSIERQDWLNLETKNALRKSTFSQSWVTLAGLQVDIMYPDRRKKHHSGELLGFEEYKLNDSEQAYTAGFAITLDTVKHPIKLLADTQAAQVRWTRALHAALSVSNLVSVPPGEDGRVTSLPSCPPSAVDLMRITVAVPLDNAAINSTAAVLIMPSPLPMPPPLRWFFVCCHCRCPCRDQRWICTEITDG